jgi:hypothetical protein
MKHEDFPDDPTEYMYLVKGKQAWSDSNRLTERMGVSGEHDWPAEDPATLAGDAAPDDWPAEDHETLAGDAAQDDWPAEGHETLAETDAAQTIYSSSEEGECSTSEDEIEADPSGGCTCPCSEEDGMIQIPPEHLDPTAPWVRCVCRECGYYDAGGHRQCETSFISMFGHPICNTCRDH